MSEEFAGMVARADISPMWKETFVRPACLAAFVALAMYSRIVVSGPVFRSLAGETHHD